MFALTLYQGNIYGSFFVAINYTIQELKSENNSCIRLVGEVWQVISKINMWDLIMDRISGSSMEKLEGIAFNILTEVDPRYFVDPQNRWLAFDKKLRHSNHIRESISNTLLLLSTLDKYNVEAWITKIFKNNLNVEAWYSYGSQLQILAEASPESFCKAIEETLDKISETHLEKLFESEDNFMGEHPYCNLLWALEVVSWNTDYLSRVILILARLSNLEVDIKISNTPFNTLKIMFLGWINYSCINYEDKKMILKNSLCKRFPDLSWKLLIELLPHHNSYTTGIIRPKYKNWGDNWSKEVDYKERQEYYQSISEFILESIGDNPQRWKEIYMKIESFSEEWVSKFIKVFVSKDKNLFTNDDRLIISTELRNRIYRNRKYCNSDWALPEETILNLEKAFKFIEPDILIDKYVYLFNSGGVLILNPIPYDSGENFSRDYSEKERVVEKLRKEAVMQILEGEGIDSLTNFIKKVGNPRPIGRILSLIDSGMYIKTILEWTESQNNNLILCSEGYISRMEFKEEILEGLSDSQISKILSFLPFNAGTFEILKRQSNTIQGLYWNQVVPYLILNENDKDCIDWVLGQLYENGQYLKGICLFSNMIERVKEKTIKIDHEVLYSMLCNVNKKLGTMDCYYIEKSINYLREVKFDKDKILSLEWLYIALEEIKPSYWENEVIKNPEVLVDLISFIYKRSLDDKLTEDQIQNRTKGAMDLLEKISIFSQPESVRESGYLKKWADGVLKSAEEKDLVEECKVYLGELLAKAPLGTDGVFPCEEVREVLEDISNEKADRAFIIAKQNLRGVFTKSSDEGGSQEHKLAKKYIEDAEKIKFLYPNVSRILKSLGDSYKWQGENEDMRKELI